MSFEALRNSCFFPTSEGYWYVICSRNNIALEKLNVWFVFCWIQHCLLGYSLILSVLLFVNQCLWRQDAIRTCCGHLKPAVCKPTKKLLKTWVEQNFWGKMHPDLLRYTVITIKEIFSHSLLFRFLNNGLFNLF